MEMCYDGALVMPSNFAVVDADEMMYLEGGVKVEVKANSPFVYYVYFSNKECKKISSSGTPVSLILSMLGKHGPLLAAVAGCYAWSIGRKNKGKGVKMTVNLSCPIFPYATVKSR